MLLELKRMKEAITARNDDSENSRKTGDSTRLARPAAFHDRPVPLELKLINTSLAGRKPR